MDEEEAFFKVFKEPAMSFNGITTKEFRQYMQRVDNFLLAKHFWIIFPGGEGSEKHDLCYYAGQRRPA